MQIRVARGVSQYGRTEAWLSKISVSFIWEGPAKTFIKTVWFTRDHDCHCIYKYGNSAVEPRDWPEWSEQLMAPVMSKCNLNSNQLPNSCNVNQYLAGSASLGFHSDDQK